MFGDGKTLWESLAAIRSTPVSATLPAPSVLLQGRNLRGSLPFLPSELAPKFVPATVVQRELSARQASAAYGQARSPDARMSALQVGQRVRALIKDRWLSGAVRSVCSEPQSYVIQLDDGRLFRRTRWAVNTDRSSPFGGVTVASQKPVQPAHDSGVRVNQFAGRPVSTPSSRSVVHPLLLPAAHLTPRVPVELDRPREPNSPALPVDFHTPRPSRLVGGNWGVPRRLSMGQQTTSSDVMPGPAVPSGGQPVPSATDRFGTTRSGARFGISMTHGDRPGWFPVFDLFLFFSFLSWCGWFVCSSWFRFFHSECSHLFVCSRVHTQTVLSGLGVILCCSAAGRLVCLSMLFVYSSLFERREML